MGFRFRNSGTLSLLAGLLVGCWIGLKILPTWSFFRPESFSAEEGMAAQAVRESLEGKLAETLRISPSIVDARVHLARKTASVTLRLSKEGAAVSAEQIESIAHQVAAGVDGLEAGTVLIFDAEGRQLNRQFVADYAQRQRWIDFAITVGKVLGILAALITLRYLIQAVGMVNKRADGVTAV